MNKKINPTRLKLARTRRQMTIKLLSEKVGLTSKMVSMYEKEFCDHTPKSETLSAFSQALNYPISFLTNEKEVEELSTDSVSFRSLKSMKASQEHAAIGAGKIGLLLNEYLNKKFPQLPKPNLLDLRTVNPEAASEAIREHWELGQKSIHNMVHLLEKQGIRVFSLAENTQSVDAFSFWKDDTPFIFLNTQKSGERSRFDAAHELGHLILHKHGTPQGRDLEAEADSFAANFLMPKTTVLSYKNSFLSIQDIIDLKINWKVSAMALIVQLKNSGAITEWQHRNLIIEASKLGLRKKEINGIESERSGLIKILLDRLHIKEGLTLKDIAETLQLPLEEVTNLIFMMGVVTSKESNSTPSKSSTPFLKLV